MTHITGPSRYQMTLLPEALDEVIAADHPVRVIDAFVDSLDLMALGFTKAVAEATGRPAYWPGDMLKLYVYGYLNQVRSSRRLEREAQRNIEVHWLINRVTPAFKTIADFRKDHPRAIVGVCRAFTQFCRDQVLFGAELLAIDGTKIGAVASRKKVMTPKRIAKRTAAIDRRIGEYLAAMDEADRQEAPAEQLGDVAAALERLAAERQKLQDEAERLAREGLKQRVEGEPDAKLMRTPHGHQVAYNAQIAVDAKHKLIAASELTNEGNDHQQLHAMALQGKEAVGAQELTALADAGYSNGEQGTRCEQDGITPIVPRAETVNTSGRQYFSRNEFSYDPQTDTWRCPAGATLSLVTTWHTQKKKVYTSAACGTCPLRARCTPAKRRLIVRDFYEDARAAMHQRATGDPVWMKLRRELAEHPIGTIKWLMGHPRFLVRGLTKARAEFALEVLSYNLKRVITILGVPNLLIELRPRPA
jgi:transposase